MTHKVHPACVLRGHTGQVQCVEYLHEHNILVSGDSSGHAHCWNLDTARSQRAELHDANAGIVQLQGLAHNLVVSQGRDGGIKVWKLQGSGVWRAQGSIAGSGYHFCRSRAHSSAAHDIPASSLTNYDPTQHRFLIYDVVNWSTVVSAMHDQKFGLCMCVQLSTHNTPLMFAGCVPLLMNLCSIACFSRRPQRAACMC
jgi:WD40 repeat protein